LELAVYFHDLFKSEVQKLFAFKKSYWPRKLCYRVKSYTKNAFLFTEDLGFWKCGYRNEVGIVK
jgi:hypothetical protein